MRGLEEHDAACPNCERAAPSIDDARFCPYCGQRLELRQLSLGEVLGEVLGSVWTLELPVLRTTRDLLLGPGPVATAWIGGKRRTYMNPVKFVVVIGALLALSYPLFELLKESEKKLGVAQHDTSLARNAPQFAALIVFGLLLPIAGSLWGLGKLFRLRRPWLSWFVLGLYCYGLACLLQLMLGFVNLKLPAGNTRTISLVTQALLPLPMLTWGAWGFVRRDEGRLRAAVLALVAQICVVAALVAINSALSKPKKDSDKQQTIQRGSTERAPR